MDRTIKTFSDDRLARGPGRTSPSPSSSRSWRAVSSHPSLEARDDHSRYRPRGLQSPRKWAKTAGLYHGALVGAGWIALEALGALPTASYSPDLLTDTAIVFATDALVLFAGAFGGWRGHPEPSSSSDKGRGR